MSDELKEWIDKHETEWLTHRQAATEAARFVEASLAAELKEAREAIRCLVARLEGYEEGPEVAAIRAQTEGLEPEEVTVIHEAVRAALAESEKGE